MGKTDRVQTKLRFNLQKTPQTCDGVQSPDRALEGVPTDSDVDLKQILVSIQHCFIKIDEKIDALLYRLDYMSERLDMHAERLNQVEWRVSAAEDEQNTMAVLQKKIDRLLHVLQAKAEDLETRSDRNKVSVVGIAEYVHIDNLKWFVEQLLTDLLGCETFSYIYIME
ncbi:hypothetical protein NDU88_001144 [Pleurodeles waltl]|uniref:Uncharacterized protein n=1 Tax=Pleurodeles waltl TaxID=8319 RepID=A0AAV7UV78_PLEWA|nr:hypothetical protein NDU88_001144 [Pleurodeles waltl]